MKEKEAQTGMPAKSFIGTMEHAARQFYATAVRGEVSDANVRGYLRAASQIEDIWDQIDDQIAETLAHGATAWEAYRQYRYPLAFIRAARTYQVFVRELLAADAAADPATAGFLPQVTYDQANALCHQIQPNLQSAVAAFTDPAYAPDVALPLVLGPRIEADGACPLTHLEGMISAAREVREWAAGLIAQYEQAVARSGSTTAPAEPAESARHLTALHSTLAQADAALRFGTDLVGQVSEDGATPELHEKAEDNLWDALRGYFLLNQAVAFPELLHHQSAPSAHPRRQPEVSPSEQPKRGQAYHDRRIKPDDLWRIASPSARSELRGTEFGRDEMQEMCEKMGGILSAGAQQYLDDVEHAVRRGDAISVGAMANCPFEPLYRAKRPLNVAGAQIAAGHEFHWNFHRGHMESRARFERVNDWQECEE